MYMCMYVHNIMYVCMHICMYRGKKISCPGAWDKLNFRQDKHIFSLNVRRASKKSSACLFDNVFEQVIWQQDK